LLLGQLYTGGDKYPIYKVEMEKKNKDRHSIEKIKAELELRKL